MPATIIISVPPKRKDNQSAKLRAALSGRVFAVLTSLDDGTEVVFARGTAGIPPSESSREYGASWQEAGVAQASPQFLEYQQTNPEIRTYDVYLDAYSLLPGGDANSIESMLTRLKRLTQRVPGKKRAHRCLWSQGEQLFLCVVERVNAPVKRVNRAGGAMVAHAVQITLKEIPGGVG
jgi:hypothetical protein